MQEYNFPPIIFYSDKNHYLCRSFIDVGSRGGGRYGGYPYKDRPLYEIPRRTNKY